MDDDRMDDDRLDDDDAMDACSAAVVKVAASVLPSVAAVTVRSSTSWSRPRSCRSPDPRLRSLRVCADRVEPARQG